MLFPSPFKAVILAMCLCAAAALVIDSERMNLRVIDGEFYANTTLSIRCLESDYGNVATYRLELEDGTKRDLDILCQRPVYTYERELIGYVPRFGQLQTIYFCALQSGGTGGNIEEEPDAEIYNGDAVTDYNTENGGLEGLCVKDPEPGPFYRMGKGRSRDSGLPSNDFGFSVLEGEAAERRLEGSGMKPQFFGIAGAVLGAIALAEVRALKNDLNGIKDDIYDQLGDLSGTMTDLEVIQKNHSLKLSDYYAQMNLQDDITNDALDSLNNQTGEIRNLLANVQGQIDLVQSANDVQDEQIENIFNQVTTMNTELSQSIAEAELRSANISQNVANLALSVDEDLRELSSEFQKAIASHDQALKLIQQRIASRFQQTSKSLTRLLGETRRNRQNTMNIQYQTQARRVFTRLAHQKITDQAAEGRTPFLSEYSTPPLYAKPSLTSQEQRALQYQDIDLMSYAYIDNDYQIHERSYRYRCQTNFFLSTMSTAYTWDMLFAVVGESIVPGDECNADYDAGPITCKCWVEVTEVACIPSGSIATKRNTFDDVNYRLDATEPACPQDPVPLPVGVDVPSDELLYVLSSDELIADLNRLCNADKLAGHNMYFNTASFQSGLRLKYLPLDRCRLFPFSDDYREDVVVTPEDALNMYYVFRTQLTEAYRLRQNSGIEVAKAIDGLLPSRLSYNYYPFVNIDDVAAVCTQGGFMAFEPEMIPVYKLRLQDATVAVPITATNPDDESAPVEEYLSTYQVIEQTFDILLPPANTLMFGDFIADNTVVYDVPWDEDILGSKEAARGMVTYNFVPEGVSFSQSAWEEYNGFKYDHFSGANTVGIYEMEVGTGRVCGSERNIAAGSWCDLLDYWNINPGFTNQILDPNVLAITPKAGGKQGQSSVSLQVELPLVTRISMQYTSACPTVTVDSITFPTGSLIDITNPANAAVDYVLVLHQFMTSSQTVKVTSGAITQIAAGATASKFVSNSGVEWTLAYLYRRKRPQEVAPTTAGSTTTISGETWILCNEGEALDVTSSRTISYTERGMADIAIVNQTEVRQYDQVFSNLVRSNADLATTSVDMMLSMVGIMFDMGLYIPEIALTNYSAIADRFIAIAEAATNSSINIVEDANERNAEAYDQLVEFRERMANISASLATQKAEFEASILRLDEIRNQTTELLGNLSRINADLAGLRQVLLDLSLQEDELESRFREGVFDTFKVTADGLGSAGNGFGLFGAIGNGILFALDPDIDAIGDVVDGAVGGIMDGADEVIDGVKEIGKAVKEVAEDIADKAADPFGLGSMLRGLADVFSLIAMVAVICIGGYLVYQYQKGKQMEKRLDAAAGIRTSAPVGGISGNHHIEDINRAIAVLETMKKEAEEEMNHNWQSERRPLMTSSHLGLMSDDQSSSDEEEEDAI